MFDAMFSEPRGNVDRLQAVCVACLMIVGVLFVYSSTMVSESAAALPLYSQLWFRQMVWYVLGLGGAFALCLVDYRLFARWSLITYGFSIFLLVLVLIPGIGSTHGWGARRWIDIGPYQGQPSEFAKLAFILAQASFLSRPPEELASPAIFLKSIGLAILPFLLIL